MGDPEGAGAALGVDAGTAASGRDALGRVIAGGVGSVMEGDGRLPDRSGKTIGGNSEVAGVETGNDVVGGPGGDTAGADGMAAVTCTMVGPLLPGAIPVAGPVAVMPPFQAGAMGAEGAGPSICHREPFPLEPLFPQKTAATASVTHPPIKMKLETRRLSNRPSAEAGFGSAGEPDATASTSGNLARTFVRADEPFLFSVIPSTCGDFDELPSSEDAEFDASCGL
jgi:hypothetical protein